MPDTTPTQAQVDQAIDWLVKLRFDSPCPRTRQQFEQWLASHPHHPLAWQRVSLLSDELAGLPKDLSRRTLEGSQQQRGSRRNHLKLLALLAVGGSLGLTAREPLGLPELLADNSTAVGERRQVQGRDGSRIQLNTASAIDLDYSVEQRQLALLRAVRRGQVTLFPASALRRQVQPGETLQVWRDGRVQAVTLHSDPWGWTDGVLSVQQMPLGEFVAELGRYRPGLLRCAPEVASLMVSGTFQLSDTGAILPLLSRSLPVRVEYHTRYWVSIAAA